MHDHPDSIHVRDEDLERQLGQNVECRIAWGPASEFVDPTGSPLDRPAVVISTR